MEPICFFTLLNLAYGVVFKATWRETPGSYKILNPLRFDSVAAKQMSVEHMSQTDIENFLNEIQLMRGLRPHSNVVQVLQNVKLLAFCLTKSNKKQQNFF